MFSFIFLICGLTLLQLISIILIINNNQNSSRKLSYGLTLKTGLRRKLHCYVLFRCPQPEGWNHKRTFCDLLSRMQSKLMHSEIKRLDKYPRQCENYTICKRSLDSVLCCCMIFWDHWKRDALSYGVFNRSG